MHRWLAGKLDAMRIARGTKLNLLGPRGGAKSTIGTLAFPLREAVEGREPYIWIVSDTKHQACAHLENIKTELLENEPAGARIIRRRRGGAGYGGTTPSCCETAW